MFCSESEIAGYFGTNDCKNRVDDSTPSISEGLNDGIVEAWIPWAVRNSEIFAKVVQLIWWG
jgi:hypothetical protein